MCDDFNNGKKAYAVGLSLNDNPHIVGVTKLGNAKFGDFDRGAAWESGFRSAMPARQASQKEIEAAAELDVSRFRKKSNRYYR